MCRNGEFYPGHRIKSHGYLDYINNRFLSIKFLCNLVRFKTLRIYKNLLIFLFHLEFLLLPIILKVSLIGDKKSYFSFSGVLDLKHRLFS